VPHLFNLLFLLFTKAQWPTSTHTHSQTDNTHTPHVPVLKKPRPCGRSTGTPPLLETASHGPPHKTATTHTHTHTQSWVCKLFFNTVCVLRPMGLQLGLQHPPQHTHTHTHTHTVVNQFRVLSVCCPLLNFAAHRCLLRVGFPQIATTHTHTREFSMFF